MKAESEPLFEVTLKRWSCHSFGTGGGLLYSVPAWERFIYYWPACCPWKSILWAICKAVSVPEHPVPVCKSPLIVSLSLEEENLLKANKKYFRDFGFEIETFGGREYSISAVPSSFWEWQKKSCFWKCWTISLQTVPRMPLKFLPQGLRPWPVRLL